jgi:ABC-type glycerol-3-phosphate transport system permease component
VKILSTALRQVLLIALVVISLYPMWFMISTALKTPSAYTLDPVGPPSHPTLSNIGAVFSQWPFLTWTRNSIIATVTSVCIATFISILASYAIVFGRTRGRETFLRTNIAMMAIPPVALLTPMYALMVQLHLINQLPSVIIFYSGLLVPFSIFFFVNFFREIPHELVEAAYIDGARPSRVLFRVIIPLSGAITFTLVIVNAIFVWNELLIALVFLQSNGSRTLMAGVALYQGRYITNEPLIMAAAFMSLLPLAVLYVFGQRFFVRGMTAGMGR